MNLLVNHHGILNHDTPMHQHTHQQTRYINILDVIIPLYQSANVAETLQFNCIICDILQG